MNILDFKLVDKDHPVIAWWSGGVTSAVTCKLCIELFGKNVVIVFIDTGNEDDDTYRFADDCERWYGVPIKTISAIGDKYNSIKDVWYKYKSLNVASGAVCSSELKRVVRERFQKRTPFSFQVFGFDIKEPKRAYAMAKNYAKIRPIFPSLLCGYSKMDCINILQEVGIDIPVTYKHGFKNNNCFKTGCVQGGVGYWQKMKREHSDKFNAMAKIEHELTDLKGVPVTMLKDQSKAGGKVFLLPHPKYSQIKDISMMSGREPESLLECNGFCGTNDLVERNDSELQINFEQ